MPRGSLRRLLSGSPLRRSPAIARARSRLEKLTLINIIKQHRGKGIVKGRVGGGVAVVEPELTLTTPAPSL